MPDEGTNEGAKPEAGNTANAGEANVEFKSKPNDGIARQAENPDAVQNALNAERQAAKEAKKRAEAAEAKVREYEDASASEVEKLTKRAERAEQKAKEADSALLRYTVAAEKGVKPELTPLLTGTTREELEQQATLLLENVKPKDPEFDGGVREPAPETKTPEQQHNEFVAQLLAGRTPDQ